MNAENMYDAWDNGDRHEIRQRFARREEITRMAREAGLIDEFHGFYESMERFAALVAAHEREECARVCEEQKLKYEERAAEPEEFRDINPEVARIAGMTCDFNAEAIRARGKK